MVIVVAPSGITNTGKLPARMKINDAKYINMHDITYSILCYANYFIALLRRHNDNNNMCIFVMLQLAKTKLLLHAGMPRHVKFSELRFTPKSQGGQPSASHIDRQLSRHNLSKSWCLQKSQTPQSTYTYLPDHSIRGQLIQDVYPRRIGNGSHSLHGGNHNYWLPRLAGSFGYCFDWARVRDVEGCRVRVFFNKHPLEIRRGKVNSYSL